MNRNRKTKIIKPTKNRTKYNWQCIQNYITLLTSEYYAKIVPTERLIYIVIFKSLPWTQERPFTDANAKKQIKKQQWILCYLNLLTFLVICQEMWVWIKSDLIVALDYVKKYL